MSGPQGLQVSFQIQVGLLKGRVAVDSTDLTLKSIKTLVCTFISEKFPEHGISRVGERILLFKHDYTASNILQMLNSVSEVTEGCIVEVVMTGQPLGDEDVEIRPHSLLIHSYKTPTFCDFCGEMLFGMFKQGLKCELCGLNYHKRCVFKIPNDCSHRKKRRNSFSDSSNSSSLGYYTSVGATSIDGSNFLIAPNREGSSSPGTPKRSSNIHGRPAWVDMHLANRLKIPHTFVLHTYTKPTKCQFCNKILVGVFKQGLQCKDCGLNVHKKCSERVPRDCTGEVPSGGGDGATSDGYVDSDDRNEEDDDEDGRGQRYPNMDDSNIVTPSNFDSHMAAQVTHSNIPVQRLVQSVRQTKRVGSKTVKEGWVFHFTNKDSMRKRHYWRLDSKSITMFKSEAGPNYYKEVPLSEILAVDTAKKTYWGCDALL